MRRTALIEILYATGLRVSELVGLPLAAMSRDGRILIVRGKGGQQKQPPPPAPRPQDGMSKEDAARIMRAVAEKEKAARQSVMQPSANKKPPSEEDW